MSDIYKQLLISIVSATSPLDLQQRIDQIQKTRTEEFKQILLCVRKDQVIALCAYVFSMMPADIKTWAQDDKVFEMQDRNGYVRVRAGTQFSLADMQKGIFDKSVICLPT